EPEGVLLRVHVGAHDFDGEANQGALDLLRAVVLVCGEIERDEPVIGRDHLHTLGGRIAVTSAGNLVDASYALTQLAAVAPSGKVLFQKCSTSGRQVGGQRVNVAGVIFLTVRRPSVQLLEDIEGERVDRLGWHVPPLAGAA